MYVDSIKTAIIAAFIAIAAAVMFTLMQAAPAMAQVTSCTGTNNTPQCQACVGAGGTFTPGSTGASGGCGDPDGTNLVDGTDSTFNNIINALTFVAGAIAVLMLIIGGVRYVISAGDQQAVANAKNTILYAVVGVIVVFVARAVILFVVDRI